MTWLVFALSGLLILAGAVSIISGAPIIQLERGWAEVIAGAVSVSGGGVVFALGVVLLRLQALHAALSQAGAASVPLAELALPTVASVPPLQLRPTVDPDVAEAAVEASDTDAIDRNPGPTDRDPGPTETRHGLWKRVRRSAEAPNKEEPVLLPELATDGAGLSTWPPGDGGPDVPGRSDADLEESTAPGQAPLLDGLRLPEAGTRVEHVVAPPVPPASRWFKPVGSRERAPAPAVSVPARSNVEADEAPPIEPPPFLAPPLDEPTSEIATTDADEATELPAEKATIVGRYKAGVASYVMFSDGTINVETEGGDVHRFESMDELKAFIATQEASVL